MIPAADTGYLLLYDNEKDRLIPKAPIGFNDNIYKFQVRVGESITGKVFEDGIGRIYNLEGRNIRGNESTMGFPKRIFITSQRPRYFLTRPLLFQSR